jgi:hypothetical protein
VMHFGKYGHDSVPSEIKMALDLETLSNSQPQ